MLSTALDIVAPNLAGKQGEGLSFPAGTDFVAGVDELVWLEDAEYHHAVVWYPARVGTGKTTKYMDVFSARALLRADPWGENHPLVILSHGFGGNRYNQAFLAEHLAARGYVCLAVSHKDHGHKHHWHHLLDRPRVLIDALRQLLSGNLANLVDATQIALVAHSAGAYAALVAAGATPRFDLEPAFGAMNEILARFDADKYRLEGVRAIVLMAPALSNLFDGPGLLKVNVPALILAAELETENLLGTAQAYGQLLRNAKSHFVEGAGHYAFINEFPPLLARLSPRVAGGDRHQRSVLHMQLYGPIENLLGSNMQRPRGLNVA